MRGTMEYWSSSLKRNPIFRHSAVKKVFSEVTWPRLSILWLNICWRRGDAKLPAEVIQKGKSHLLDSLAAIVSGSTLKPGKLGLQHARAQGGREECSVLGSNLKTTPILAAFANGMSGHADETDDSNSQLHPGCAIVPAALAIAESQNRSGEALLRAVILGYDIGFRFHQAFEPRSTSFGATFGCAAAAGALAELDDLHLRYLISYAAQQASGSRAWVGDDDHIEKAFDYAGMPARNGVTAALLIQSGFTGNRDVLEGDQGIIKTYAPCDPAKILERAWSAVHDHQLFGEKISRRLADDGDRRRDVGAAFQASDSMPSKSKKSIVRIPESGARTVNNRHMPDVNVQYHGLGDLARRQAHFRDRRMITSAFKTRACWP